MPNIAPISPRIPPMIPHRRAFDIPSCVEALELRASSALRLAPREALSNSLIEGSASGN